MSKIILKQIKIFLYFYPWIYIFAAIINNKSIYALKDFLAYFIIIQIVLYIIKSNSRLEKKYVLLLFFISLYVLINSLAKVEDFQFWFYGVREMIVTPLVYIVIGLFIGEVNTTEGYFENIITKSLMISVVLTIIYMLMFPGASFSQTHRLFAFWNSEHEPAILSGLLIILLIYNKNVSKSIKAIMFLFCMVIIFLSASRSVFIATLIGLMVPFLRKISIKNLFCLGIIIIISIFLFDYYTQLTHRDIFYNLIARTRQYHMAFEIFKNHPLTGIGIDKYGVVGNNVKVMVTSYGATTTMDSTIIKYLTNLGLFYYTLLLIFTLNIIKDILYIMKKCWNKYNYMLSILSFSLIIGCFTGKLGAFPLNLYFFVLIGYIIKLKGENEQNGFLKKERQICPEQS